jgi:hypothetical protein
MSFKISSTDAGLKNEFTLELLFIYLFTFILVLIKITQELI